MASCTAVGDTDSISLYDLPISILYSGALGATSYESETDTVLNAHPSPDAGTKEVAAARILRFRPLVTKVTFGSTEICGNAIMSLPQLLARSLRRTEGINVARRA